MKNRIVADVGNSAVKIGHFRGDELVGRWRVVHDDRPLPDRLDTLVDVPERFSSALCAVVPARAEAVAEWLRSRGGSEPLKISPDVRLPFHMAYETPATLGADRIAVAAGALSVLGDARRAYCGVVAVDAGTAVTCDVVDGEDQFRGGIIAPGPSLLRRSLVEGTAQLPAVDLVAPRQTIGRSTGEALRSGIMLGFVETVRGLVARMAAELGHSPHVVVTGGWGILLGTELDSLDAVDPDLVLRGVNTIAARNE